MEILGKALTTIRIGGPIDTFEQPTTTEQLVSLLRQSTGLRKAIGGGSNLVFADAGFRGLVIQPMLQEIEKVSVNLFHKEITEWQATKLEAGRYSGDTAYASDVLFPAEGQCIWVGSGVPWAKLIQYCFTHCLQGLEKYARIPCRVGGAIRNNIHAGAELLGVHVIGVEAVDEGGNISFYSQESLAFGYDTSRFVTHREVITRVLFRLQQVSPEQSAENEQKYRQIIELKTAKQPSGANCGSVFQNREPYEDQPVAAAWYIEHSGCKGLRVGELEVSTRHANFITNLGGGSQNDFLELVQSIQQIVLKRFEILLVPEVEAIDEQGNSQWIS